MIEGRNTGTSRWRIESWRCSRLEEQNNVSELCQELGISRQLLYQWRDRLRQQKEQQDPAKARLEQLWQENAQLKKVLADKMLALDFLKGALQKVEALRQTASGCGETASTSKSGRRCRSRTTLGVEPRCRVAGVSRAGFYPPRLQRSTIVDRWSCST